MPRNDRDSWLFEPDDTIGETVAEGIYLRVIDLILFGEFAHGDRLILQDLAARFSVSLTPVREALQRLSADGFIESEPRKGYRVKSPSAQQVKDLWNVRAGMEAVAAETVIERIAAGELRPDALDPLFAIQHTLDEDSRLTHRRHMELNARFHQTLVTLSNNRLLINLYRGIQIQLLSAWVQRGTQEWRERLASEAREHRAILNAIKKLDRAAAREAARSHVLRSLDGAIRDLLLKQKRDPRTKGSETQNQGGV
jgi:DNA-binding GntR family transcriptional regulator